MRTINLMMTHKVSSLEQLESDTLPMSCCVRCNDSKPKSLVDSPVKKHDDPLGNISRDTFFTQSLHIRKRAQQGGRQRVPRLVAMT